jgi:hypothetical protein
VAAHNAAWRNSPRDRKLITVVFDPGVQVRPQGRDQTAKKSAKWGQTKPPPQNYVENNVARFTCAVGRPSRSWRKFRAFVMSVDLAGRRR